MSFPLQRLFAAAVSACLTVLAALPLWRKWCLRAGLVDDPGKRKIHDQPIPLAGGLAVMTGLLVPALLACLVLWWQKAGGGAGGGPSTPVWLSTQPGVWHCWIRYSGFLLQYGLGRRAVELAGIFLGAFGMLWVGWLDDKHELRPRRQVRRPIAHRRAGRRQRRAYHALCSQPDLQLRHHHPVDSHRHQRLQLHGQHERPLRGPGGDWGLSISPSLPRRTANTW